MLRILLIVTALVVLNGCFFGGRSDDEVSCDDTARYAISDTIPPVRVPDDLSVPDESESLTIPPNSVTTEAGEGVDSACLESPPDFFEEDD